MDYNEKLHDMFDEIENMVSDSSGKTKNFLLDLFNLLFWKDYRAGYVDFNTRHELMSLYDYYVKYVSGEDEWYGFSDDKHVHDVITKVRKMIGLEEELPN